MPNLNAKHLYLFFILLTNFCYHCKADTCPVYLTLSPLSKNLEESQIIINWGPDCESPPDQISLYNKNPAISLVPPVISINVQEKKYGKIVTEHKFGRLHLPGGWNNEQALRNIPRRVKKPHCLNYYVQSFKNNNLESFECLKVNPNWMFNEKGIENVPLKDLFLPGTHCSGCYMTKSNVLSHYLRKMGYHQDMDIWSQLVFGIRYLDFSVGYFASYNNSKSFYVMSNGFKVQNITPLLRDIRKFVVLSEEIVIIDLRSFPLGFHTHPERHVEFIELLEQELGDIAFRRRTIEDPEDLESFNLTVGDLRRQGKYVLISYNHESILNETDLVWKSWKKHSSAYLKTSELPEYMKNLFSGKMEHAPKEIGWVLYGIQGMQSSMVDTEEILSPRVRANNINSQLTTMLGGPWSRTANAVLLDFFTETNLIDMAIHTNRYKVMKTMKNTVIDIQ